MKKHLFAMVAAPAFVLASLPALAQGYGEPGSYWDHDWGWGHMIFGSLMMILFWGGLIVLVVLAIRWLGAGSSKRSARRTAVEILEERFARGEIDKEEFEERKHLLSD